MQQLFRGQCTDNEVVPIKKTTTAKKFSSLHEMVKNG